MDLGIAGRKAIVAGGSAGLGKASARALAGEGVELVISARGEARLLAAAREIAEATIGLDKLQADLVKSLSRAPEPEPADEEVLDLIPTDQNIFGLQDISAEEEAQTLPVEHEEMNPDDLEAAIEAELAGRNRR